MAKTVYEHLMSEKDSCERIAKRYREELRANGPSAFIAMEAEHFEIRAKALELAAQNLPVEVAEKEI